MKVASPSELVTDKLRRDIQSGTFKPSGKLPSRKDLAKHYDIALETLRKVLATLEIEGVITKGKGRSLVVSNQRERVTANAENFRDYMLDQGYTVKVEQLDTPGIIEATPRLAHIFHVEVGTPLVERGRREIVDGVVYRYSKKYYLASLINETDLKRIQLDNTYDVKKVVKNQKSLKRVQERIIARNITTNEEAAILGVSKGIAVLEQWKINYAEDMTITWVSMVVFNGAYFEKIYDYDPGDEPHTTL